MGVIHCRELDRVITEVQLKPAGSSVKAGDLQRRKRLRAMIICLQKSF